jgi:hypothetical protein
VKSGEVKRVAQISGKAHSNPEIAQLFFCDRADTKKKPASFSNAGNRHFRLFGMGQAARL